jgi:membrane protein implicated in regulation of membrane protease activity
MISPTLAWFIVGILLIILELLVPLPTMLAAAALGLGALIVSGVMYLIPVHISVGFFIWVLTSAFFVWYSRRFIPKGNWNLKDADEGITLTEIPAGETGRVKYEGNSWKAKCEDVKVAIAASEIVYVMRKQGTTLIVVPKSWLEHHQDS